MTTNPPIPDEQVEAVARAIRDERNAWADLSGQGDRFPIDDFDRQLARAAIAALSTWTVADEREACAKLVEEWNGSTRDGDTFHIAAAIRGQSGD